MGHSPLRTEKDCLNCGTLVPERFCPHCGQENIVPRQSFVSLATHFIADILHFDGKFWSTLKHLLLRPGFVPREYVLGRRASFLDPIRMYLFTSAIFFFVFFSILHLEEAFMGGTPEVLTSRQRLGQAHSLMDSLKRRPEDTLLKKQVDILLDTSLNVRLKRDSFLSEVYPVRIDSVPYRLIPTPRDSIGLSTRSDWVERTFGARLNQAQDRAEGSAKLVVADLANVFLHRLPYMLFISLPLFAGIMMLVNYRRRKLYSEHAIFTLYHYIFAFILLMFVFGIYALEESTGWAAFSFIRKLLNIYIFVYLLLGMKHFYRQGWGRTAVKFVAVNLLGALMLFLVFALSSVLILIF